jgi:hypothetical protein
METRNGIDKLLSIFDLTIFKALNLQENISARVMFRYDKETNRSEFKVLNKGISREISHRIENWLEDNIKDYNEIANLNTGKMDADNVAKSLAL